jgi:arylsulfatase A-like enzyme
VLVVVWLAGTSACTDSPVPRDELPNALRALDAPNIVFIVCDTTRADWLTPYGAAENTSPELARWADHGVLFERVGAQSSWTKTSMASLLTSLWPSANRVVRRRDGLAEGALTLAEVFRSSGYATYAVQSNGWLEQTFGFHQGFDHYSFPRGGGNAAIRTSIWPHADNIYREAMRLLDDHPDGRPFFLYLHLMDVHEYGAPPEFHRFGSDSAGAYRAAIQWVDHVLERLRKNLDDRGLLGRTLLVFGSDHGEAFGENQRQGHAKNVLSAVVHVPLIVRLPFATEPIRIPAQARNLDVAPTLLELAGLEVPDAFQGQSLLASIVEPGASEDRVSFASLDERLFPDASIQKSVRGARWVYARNLDASGGTEAEFLFDRDVDPREDVNLISVEKAHAERMRAQLDAHLAAPARTDTREADVRIDPALAEKLRALGYGS